MLVVSGSEKSAGRLCDALPRDRFNPVNVQSSGSEARRHLVDTPYDLVVINAPLPDEYGTELALTAASDPHRGVLLLVPGEMFEQTADTMEPAGVLTLGKPTSAQMAYQALRMLMATRERLSVLEEKNVTLAAKMEEIKIVNRAKWVLIRQLKMDEADAHRYMEKMAMNARMTRREVAQNILVTYENR